MDDNQTNVIGSKNIPITQKREPTKHGLKFKSNGDDTCDLIGTGFFLKDDFIVIPEEYKGMRVTGIGNEAFKDCLKATKILIPNTVTEIGNSAFKDCKKLTAITIPHTVTKIGTEAFSGCSGLTTLSVPQSVTRIGEGAFSGCSSLASIILPFVGGSDQMNTANSSTLFGYVFGRTRFNDSKGIRQFHALCRYDDYYIPKTLSYVTITGGSLLFGAFSGCSCLTGVLLDESVTSIGYKAFYNCAELLSIAIPNTVTIIKGEAFSGCTGLTSVTIPESVTSIGYKAFSGCTGLEEVSFAETMKNLGKKTFYGCKSLKSFTIPDKAKNIGEALFWDCSNLSSMTIGKGVSSIDKDAFFGCFGLKNIVYNGTTEEWNAINKSTDWNTDIPAKEVVCSDGSVSL